MITTDTKSKNAGMSLVDTKIWCELLILISVQQLADDKLSFFWLQEDWRKVERLRKVELGPYKDMPGTCCNRNWRSL